MSNKSKEWCLSLAADCRRLANEFSHDKELAKKLLDLADQYERRATQTKSDDNGDRGKTDR